VLDPGRRSHAIDALAVEFLGVAMTGYDELCGKGKNEVPYAEVPITAARDYSCADSDLALRLRALLEAASDLDLHSLTVLRHGHFVQWFYPICGLVTSLVGEFRSIAHECFSCA